ncbi:MAG: futalosine hydrolase [Planctomycetota bacterium]|nr:futalosine hydrolase [Planctomycetota bacterium]
MKRTLLLVPTQYELSMIDPEVLRTWRESNVQDAPLESLEPAHHDENRIRLSDSVVSSKSQISIALCGFGLAVAGARTAQLLAALQPDHVILMGIAGRLGNTLKVGQAYCFSEVCCYGIGAGTGSNYQTSSELGWMHWNGDEANAATNDLAVPVSDQITLDSLQSSGHSLERLNLLSVASASGDDEDTKLKLTKYPDAVAEEMEGFAVAAACQLAGVPLSIVRGISNQAGDRNHKNWCVREAMESVVVLVNSLLASEQVSS